LLQASDTTGFMVVEGATQQALSIKGIHLRCPVNFFVSCPMLACSHFSA
jgi:hypothetical protein